MSKKIGIIVASIVGVILFGFGMIYFSVTSSGTELSKSEAEDIITSQYPGKINGEVEKDATHGYYHAVIEHNGKAYDVKIDGNTGEVLNLKKLQVPVDDHSTENQEDKNAADSKKKKNEENQNNHEKSNENEVVIDIEKAKELALEQFDGTVEDIEKDEDDGIYVYEVKVVNGEDEAEITIDASTGEIIYKDIDVEREDED
ncbi:PepSY domain-containing protein [Virgibacillus salexigens]|uniref:PepSY domain-containing protein n=1 Tax=Virgibacillus TaxID=84406 RepID=UPI00136E45C0|nr:MULTISPECIES: PepSY domain-containing protein [Virgibacillus]MYL43843.1 hypothetical protein [Virgibacillus massiliensis]